jgi:hypothetical protein
MEINDLQTPFTRVHLLHCFIHSNHDKHTANEKLRVRLVQKRYLSTKTTLLDFELSLGHPG